MPARPVEAERLGLLRVHMPPKRERPGRGQGFPKPGQSAPLAPLPCGAGVQIAIRARARRILLITSKSVPERALRPDVCITLAGSLSEGLPGSMEGINPRSRMGRVLFYELKEPDRGSPERQRVRLG